MMTNLFSMFDPSNFSYNLSWVIPLIILMSPLFKNNSKQYILIKKMTNPLISEFHTLTNSNMSNNMLIPMFMSILFMNLVSMIPSLFSMTAQMSTILPMALTMWVTNIIYLSMNKTNKMLSHMVPMGSPHMLMPILIVIEIMSNLIRPITLSIRLVANIMSGHLLMHLLSSFTCMMVPSLYIIILIPASMLLNMLELSVTLIQSFIMCTMIAMYSNEVN